jgi:metal-dependent HD superfamily phosphatase/phosphodiesterase
MSKATFVKEITVEDLNGNPVEMEVYQHENGGLFAIDSSFVDQVLGDEFDRVVIPDPFNEGFMLELEEN